MPAVFCLFWHGRDTLLGTSFNYLRRYRRGQGVNRSKFDRLFAEGREALLSGLYRMESAPVDGVARWGIGAVLRPDPIAAQAIEQVAVAVAGVERAAVGADGLVVDDPEFVVHRGGRA